MQCAADDVGAQLIKSQKLAIQLMAREAQLKHEQQGGSASSSHLASPFASPSTDFGFGPRISGAGSRLQVVQANLPAGSAAPTVPPPPALVTPAAPPVGMSAGAAVLGGGASSVQPCLANYQTHLALAPVNNIPEHVNLRGFQSQSSRPEYLAYQALAYNPGPLVSTGAASTHAEPAAVPSTTDSGRVVLPSASNQILDVEFHHQGHLGLVFPQGVVPLMVAAVQDGLAQGTPGLQPGMLLMGIQGASTARLTYSQTLERIREVGRPLRLTFARPDTTMQQTMAQLIKQAGVIGQMEQHLHQRRIELGLNRPDAATGNRDLIRAERDAAAVVALAPSLPPARATLESPPSCCCCSCSSSWSTPFSIDSSKVRSSWCQERESQHF